MGTGVGLLESVTANSTQVGLLGCAVAYDHYSSESSYLSNFHISKPKYPGWPSTPSCWLNWSSRSAPPFLMVMPVHTEPGRRGAYFPLKRPHSHHPYPLLRLALGVLAAKIPKQVADGSCKKNSISCIFGTGLAP